MEDELSHDPNEGAPIWYDMLEVCAGFMQNCKHIADSCFGSNTGFLNILLANNTENMVLGWTLNYLS